jgi:hydrogenase nickel incorporation protein HypA/HybF
MQEFSIITNIIKIVDEISEKENFSKVNKVNLMIGKMRQVVPETLTFAFETISKGTKCEAATLNIEHVAIKVECNICGKVYEVDKFDYVCPECEKADLKLLAGQEIVLKSIEGD